MLTDQFCISQNYSTFPTTSTKGEGTIVCMEDVAIGKKALSEQHTTTLNTGNAVLLVPPNENRFTLLFPSVQNAVVLLKPFQGDFSDTDGAGMVFFSPWLLTLKDHGGLVTCGWYACSTVDATPFWWAESLFYPQYFGDK